MNIKIVKPYNDQPHFGGSTRDSFYELLLDDSTALRVVKCDDKHCRQLGNIELLSVNEKLTNPLAVLSQMGYNVDKVLDAIEKTLD
jgi:hypothetical protein